MCTRVALRASLSAARRAAPRQLRPLATEANDALDSVDYRLVSAMSKAANEALFRKLDANQDGVLDNRDLTHGSDQLQAYLAAGLPSAGTFSAGFLLGLRS